MNEFLSAQLIDHMGEDLSVVRSARVSFGRDPGEVLTPRDVKLIAFLADHEHLTPFESCVVTMRVTCPMFIRAQIAKHRTFSTNDVSRRYTSEGINFYIPAKFRRQAESNRQASAGEIDDADGSLHRLWQSTHTLTYMAYQEALRQGVCREQARGLLCQDLITYFYMTGNLRNWVHFVKLRLDPHAQHEVQVIAEQMKQILFDLYPVAVTALFKESTT